MHYLFLDSFRAALLFAMSLREKNAINNIKMLVYQQFNECQVCGNGPATLTLCDRLKNS